MSAEITAAGEANMRRRFLLALLPFALGLPLAFAIVPKAVSAAQYVLKWAVVTRGDMQEKFGHKLAEVLPQATNGRVEVQVFAGGQLGSPAAMIEGLQLGTIEAYENPADFFTGVDPRFGVFSIPFLFKSTEQANKVLADPEYNDFVMHMAEAKGLIGVNLAVAAESNMRRRFLLALLPFALGVPLAFAIVPKAVSAAQYVLKWAVVTRGDMQEKFGHKLAEVLPQATNGRVEVQVFAGGQLGSPAAMIEGLPLGTIEAYENPADFFTGVDPRFGIFSIPFLFKSTEQANKVLADPEYNDFVMHMAEAKGLIGVNLAV